ncbi:maltooligosyl trehalose synthase [Sanguibacter gelidistatuariae]|uniref:Maltooligosyl trehalose synthase n=1 Tax=Sanguibacter gelidistatuariae TaxID=1814289 RepID=A0A1G6RPG5_9MICO|nr:malto-oligosyltrehalose synthase [Sanguibacter gelidistatuariae]SDD05875.1 maltooligosyl trehalose synthase [Sanguibacter gelidistatuariae]
MEHESERAGDRRFPAPGRPTPLSTYRLQLGADLTFDDVRARLDYYVTLGATHLYLSPVLTAAPGSTHGYDVVDHSTVSEVLGGRAGLDRLAASARASGLGLVLDIVPNHMALPTPAWHNAALWSVLTLGPESPYASWFDIDFATGDGAILMPVLGARIGDVLAVGELTLDIIDVPGVGETQVLRYHEHVFPLREGTESLPLIELVDRQHYRLAHWRVGDEELNYRRFFDVGTLVAVRVEDPVVFDQTHALILELLEAGVIDGLRIDHPDGLADPAGYLARLSERSGGAWVVVEKILAGEEEVPRDWVTMGTTGYEGLWRVQSTFMEPAGEARLASLMHRVTGDEGDSLPALIDVSKREVISGPLYAEVHRLTDLAAEICREDLRLRDHTWRALHECLTVLLVCFDRYRAYVVPGEVTSREALLAMGTAAAAARTHLDTERAQTLDVLVELLLGREVGSAGRRREARRDELVVRFQQVCGAVMAKGVEDTAFYRWTHLTSLCEVGGEPSRFALSQDDFHAFAAHLVAHSPAALTTGSTHDTKRSEDTRAALGVLSEMAEEWAELVGELRARSARSRSALVDGRTENLLWQTIAGTWSPAGGPDGVGSPINFDRLEQYLRKATREAKTRTSWTHPDDSYEEAVLALAGWVLKDPQSLALYEAWARRTAPAVRAAVLGTKLVRLTMPGVADVYQGSETFAPTLVDPDNRQSIDAGALGRRLDRLDDGARPRDLADEKLWVTSRALRVRRGDPGAFLGPEAGYRPLAASSGAALAFARTERGEATAVTVATRGAVRLQRLGGWGEHTLVLPEGRWLDVLTGRAVAGGEQPVAELLDALPVALMVREDS